MASKRLKKKQQKKNLLQQAQQIGVKNTSNISYADLQNIITDYQEQTKRDAQKAEKTRRQRERRAANKQQLLDAGFLPHEIKAYMYSSQKSVDRWIELRKLEGEKSPIDQIDWYSKRDTGKGFFIAFKDMSENFTLQEIINMYKDMTPAELVAELNRIKNVKPSYSKRKGKGKKKSKSSGKAGLAKYQYAPKNILQFNRGRKKGWQTLNFNGQGWFDFTLYKVTVAITAIMNHIVETERGPLYQNFYVDICEIEPLMANVLERP